MSRNTPLMFIMCLTLAFTGILCKYDTATIKQTSLIKLIGDKNATDKDVVKKIDQLSEIETGDKQKSKSLISALKKHLVTVNRYDNTAFDANVNRKAVAETIDTAINQFISQTSPESGSKIASEQIGALAKQTAAQIYSEVRAYNKLMVFKIISGEAKIKVTFDLFQNETMEYVKNLHDSASKDMSNVATYKFNLRELHKELKSAHDSEDLYSMDEFDAFFESYPLFSEKALDAIGRSLKRIKEDADATGAERHNTVYKLFAIYSALVENGTGEEEGRVPLDLLKSIFELFGISLFAADDQSEIGKVLLLAFSSQMDIATNNKEVAYLHNLFYNNFTDNALTINESNIEAYTSAYENLMTRGGSFMSEIFSLFYFIGNNFLQTPASESTSKFVKYFAHKVVQFLAKEGRDGIMFFRQFDHFLNSESTSKDDATLLSITKVVNASVGSAVPDDEWKSVRLGSNLAANFDEFNALVSGGMAGHFAAVMQNAGMTGNEDIARYITSPKTISRDAFGGMKYGTSEVEAINVSGGNNYDITVEKGGQYTGSLSADKGKTRIIKVIQGELSPEAENFLLEDDLVGRLKKGDKPSEFDDVFMVNFVPMGTDCHRKISDMIFEKIKNAYI